MKIKQKLRNSLNSVLVFTVLILLSVVFVNQDTHAESLSLTISGFDSGNSINFDFQGLVSESAKVKDLGLKVVTDNVSGYYLTIASAEKHNGFDPKRCQ